MALHSFPSSQAPVYLGWHPNGVGLLPLPAVTTMTVRPQGPPVGRRARKHADDSLGLRAEDASPRSDAPRGSRRLAAYARDRNPGFAPHFASTRPSSVCFQLRAPHFASTRLCSAFCQHTPQDLLCPLHLWAYPDLCLACNRLCPLLFSDCLEFCLGMHTGFGPRIISDKETPYAEDFTGPPANAAGARPIFAGTALDYQHCTKIGCCRLGSQTGCPGPWAAPFAPSSGKQVALDGYFIFTIIFPVQAATDGIDRFQYGRSFLVLLYFLR